MTKTPPFAVLFDLDGVLIDSHTASLHSQKYMGDLYGFTLQEVRSCSHRGGSLRDFYTKLQQLRPFKAAFEVFADTMLAENFVFLETHTHKKDEGLVMLINDLKKHGIPIAVGTSALKRSALRKLAIVDLDNIFDLIVTSDDVERHKPHPDVYLETAKRLGVKPAHCIVIEDAEAGIAAGKAAGMKVVGVGQYVEDRNTLKKADLIIADFTKLNRDKLAKLLKK